MAYKLLVGGYTHGGLRVITFDPSNNKLDLQSTRIPVGPDPSWIVQHPRDTSLILATSEVEDGKLHVIRLKDGEELSGEVVTSVSSGGTYPAHFLVLDDSVITGNYMGGSILDVPYSLAPVSLKDHGSEKTQGVHIQFSGTGPNPDRQESSHPHEVYLHGNELLVPDLGADKTWRLVKGDSGWEIKGAIEYPAGSGPRHVLIHDGVLYTVLELSNEIALHKFASLPDTPSPIATLSTFGTGSPADPSMLAAEILLSPDKRFIYVSNRNDPSPEGDTLAVYSVHSASQECKLVNEIRTGVKHARGMKFSKDGTYLAVAGSHTGSLKVFKVVEGSSNGELTEVASVEGLEKPTSVVWL